MSDEIVICEKPDWVSWEQIHELLFLCHSENRERGFNVKTAFLTGEELKNKVGETGKCFVALIGEKLVGTTSYIVKDIKRWYHSGEAAYIMLVGVHPNYRNKHILSKLFQFQNEDISKTSCKIIYLNTAEDNYKMQGACQRFGYSFTRFFHAKDTDHNTIEMVKWMDGKKPSNIKIKYHFYVSKLKIKMK